MKVLKFNQFLNERTEMSNLTGDIVVQRSGKSIQYTLLDNNNIIGDIRIEDGHVQAVSAEKGYGPLMLMDHYPNWLRPGSGSTTDQAFEVWQRFADRTDVESEYAGEQTSDRSEKYDKLSALKFRMKPTQDFNKLIMRDLTDEDERIVLNKKAGTFFMKKIAANHKIKNIDKDKVFRTDIDF